MSWLIFLLGVLVGWITKFPLILKWYRELKETRAYEEMMFKKRIEEYNKTNQLP